VRIYVDHRTAPLARVHPASFGLVCGSVVVGHEDTSDAAQRAGRLGVPLALGLRPLDFFIISCGRTRVEDPLAVTLYCAASWRPERLTRGWGLLSDEAGDRNRVAAAPNLTSRSE